MHITIGADVGKRQDPTAIAVARREVGSDGEKPRYWIDALSRLELGMSHTRQAEKLVRVSERTADHYGHRPKIYIDATGVGEAFCDICRDLGLAFTPVYFVHGVKRTESKRKARRGRAAIVEVKMGKEWLASRLQGLFQANRVTVCRCDEADALKSEMGRYEINVKRSTGSAQFGARKGHDDLVTAVGLACQDEGFVQHRCYSGHSMPGGKWL